MHYRTKIILVISLIFLNGFQLTVRAGDCGNGLLQHLSIGGQSWVIPQPPKAVNVRSAPNGKLSGQQLQPSELFTVLAGPICANDISWWQVKSNSGISGWIAEGTDEYFVEPIAIEGNDNEYSADNSQATLLPTNDLDCVDSQVRKLNLGLLVHLNDVPENIEVFYGHPLVNGTLFNVHSYPDIFERGLNQYLKYGEFIIVDGPFCFNSGLLWRVNGTYAGDIYSGLWFYEADSHHRGLVPSLNQLTSSSAYNPKLISLSQNEPAPILSGETQVSYVAVGGGPEINELWQVPNCSVTELWAIVYTYDDSCVPIYPFLIGSSVNVELIQPDGKLYKSQNLIAEAVTIRTRLPQNSANSNNQLIEYEIGVVNVILPTTLGLQTGVWTIKATSENTVITRAYWLTTPTETQIIEYCDGAKPLLGFINFPPHKKVDLILAEPSDIRTEDGEILANMHEKYRWRLEVGTQGELLAMPDLEVLNGVFYETENIGEVVNPNDKSKIHTDALWDCKSYDSRAKAAISPLKYGDVVTGAANDVSDEPSIRYYTFEGHAGDIVTIQASAFSQIERSQPLVPLDLKISLESENRTILVENDNSDNPKHSKLDSEINEFILPQDGSYSIAVTWAKNIDYFNQNYVLKLDKSFKTN